MEEIRFAPGFIKAVIADGNVDIKWKEPFSGVGTETSYIFDDGTAEEGWQVDVASTGNIYEVNQDGAITSVDVFVYSPGNAYKLVTLDIFNEDRELVGSSEPFDLVVQTWVNVKLDYVPFEGTFYAMVTSHDGAMQFANYIGLDVSAPPVGYMYDPDADRWIDLGFGLMIRVNAIAEGKSVSYGSNNNRSFIDYALYRLKKGQPTNEWTTVINSTSKLQYTDEEWSTLPYGEYQYAVRARYTDGALSNPRISGVLEKDMYANYDFLISTNTGESAEGAVVTLKNKDGNANHIYTDNANSYGDVTFTVWKGIYDVTVKLKGFPAYEIIDLEITENGQSIVFLCEKLYPVEAVSAEYFKDNNNVVINWNLSEFKEVTYILDTGDCDNGYNARSNRACGFGNKFEVNEGGYITSVDVYGRSNMGNTNRTVYIRIYDEAQQLVGESDEFVLAGNNWVNVPINDVEYSGTFYAFVWTPATIGGTHFVGYSYTDCYMNAYVENDVISVPFHVQSLGEKPGAFMVRVNANCTGKSVSYGYNNNQPEGKTAFSDNFASYSSIFNNFDNEKVTVHECIPPYQSKTSKEMIDYSVYRLTPGQPEVAWTRIASGINDFTYTDNNVSSLPQRTYQYAVKIRYSGNVLSNAVLSNTVQFDVNIENNSLSAFTLYPNPFKNEINISNPDLVRNVIITNTTGQKIKSVVFDGKTISTGEITSGVYFVTVESITGEKIVHKMIKK